MANAIVMQGILPLQFYVDWGKYIKNLKWHISLVRSKLTYMYVYKNMKISKRLEFFYCKNLVILIQLFLPCCVSLKWNLPEGLIWTAVSFSKVKSCLADFKVFRYVMKKALCHSNVIESDEVAIFAKYVWIERKVLWQESPHCRSR